MAQKQKIVGIRFVATIRQQKSESLSKITANTFDEFLSSLRKCGPYPDSEVKIFEYDVYSDGKSKVASEYTLEWMPKLLLLKTEERR